MWLERLGEKEAQVGAGEGRICSIVQLAQSTTPLSSGPYLLQQREYKQKGSFQVDQMLVLGKKTRRPARGQGVW